MNKRMQNMKNKQTKHARKQIIKIKLKSSM